MSQVEEPRYIVTAGYAYIDIDGYASSVALAELLQKQGKNAVAVTTAPLNESVNKSVRAWRAPIKTSYEAEKNDRFIVVDISEPDFLDKIVDVDRLEEIIDHHTGHEPYWQEQGKNVFIDFVGAAATLIYERWQAASLQNEISPLSAKLLVTAILDNTLNFGAHVTTERDHDAYNELLKKADLPNDWPAKYFAECQQSILENPAIAIKNDAKILKFPIQTEPLCFGQLAVWDAKDMLANNLGVVESVLAVIRPDWFMNLISIGDSKSYFICKDTRLREWLSNLLDIEFEGDIATANRLWLRKEVVKESQK